MAGSYKSLLAPWIGGASDGTVVTSQGGTRSLLAFWAGGASSGIAPPAQGSVKSMLAYWAGGASGVGGAPTQDGRSGYWRLFFYQLQEEALKNAEKTKHTGSMDAPKVVNAAKPLRKKPAKVKRNAEVVESDFSPDPLPNFKRKPTYTQPSSYEELSNLPHETLAVEATRLQSNIYQFSQHLAAKQKRIRNRRRAAAFLLLAA